MLRKWKIHPPILTNVLLLPVIQHVQVFSERERERLKIFQCKRLNFRDTALAVEENSRSQERTPKGAFPLHINFRRMQVQGKTVVTC